MKSIWQVLYAIVAILIFVAILFEQSTLYLVAHIFYIVAQYLIIQGLLKHETAE